jgi:hypothetical protein
MKLTAHEVTFRQIPKRCSERERGRRSLIVMFREGQAFSA